MQLDSLGGHVHRGLRGIKLGHGGGHAVAGLLRNVMVDGCAVDEQLGRVAAGRHVGELELGVLELAQRLAELLAGLYVIDSDLERAFRKAEGLCGNADTAAVQRIHGDLVAFAGFAQEVLFRDTAVGKDEFIGRAAADTHFLFLRAEGEAGRALFHDEGRDALAAERFVGHGEDDIGIGIVAVGDEHLGAVQHVFIAVKNGLGLLARSIRAGAGFGQAERAELITLGKRDEVFLLLLLGTEMQDGHLAQRGVSGEDDSGGTAQQGALLRSRQSS